MDVEDCKTIGDNPALGPTLIKLLSLTELPYLNSAVVKMLLDLKLILPIYSVPVVKEVSYAPPEPLFKPFIPTYNSYSCCTVTLPL